MSMFENTRLNNKKDLDTMIEKPLFTCDQLNTPLSLITASTNRYSDFILGQVYQISKKFKASKQKGKDNKNDKKDQGSINWQRITFRRNQIIFKGRQSVMLIVRDVSD